MSLIQWDPFRDLMTLSGRLNDAYGSWAPPVDIFEDGDELVIRAEVPGVERDDIDIRVEDNRLVIAGERKRDASLDEKNAYRLERRFGAFTRSFLLPKTVDAARINARHKNGVLEVRLPKAEAARPRRIEIHAA